jgi:glycosyltransferase involved in cell wall biosynthesis
MHPQISIIIPVFNSEKYITETLNSVFDQGLDNLEVICVDDGSNDRSAELIKTYEKPVTYIYQQNQGAPAARNTGIARATAPIIGLLDSDDTYALDSLKKRFNILENNKETMAVIGKTKFLFMEGHNRDKWNISENDAPVYNTLYGSGLYRKELFETIGKFDEHFRLSDDFDWFTRLRESGLPVIYMEETTLYYRQHNSNMTKDADLMKHDILALLRKSLTRRRESDPDAVAQELPSFRNSVSDLN